MSDFDINDPKYRCCCGSIHVTLGAKIFLGIYIVGLALNVLFSFPLSLIWSWIPLIIIICTIFAFTKESPGLLLPRIILLILGLLFQVIGFIGLIVLGFFFKNAFLDVMEIYNEQAGKRMENDSGFYLAVLVVAIIIGLVSVALTIWELHVYIKCKRFYTAKRMAMAQSSIQPYPILGQPQSMAPPAYVGGPPTYANPAFDEKALDSKY